MREVAQHFRVSVGTVHYWVERAGDKPLSQVDWNDRPPVAHLVRRTDRAMENLVLTVRRELKENSVLGEYGAPAIHRELLGRGVPHPPSIRTVGRILQRRGALDRRRRLRHPPPPPGWYLPDVAAGQVGQQAGHCLIEFGA